MHEVLVNRLGGLSLPRKSVVRLANWPDMILDVYRGHNTTTKATQLIFLYLQNTHESMEIQKKLTHFWHGTVFYAKGKFGCFGFCLRNIEKYLFFNNCCSL